MKLLIPILLSNMYFYAQTASKPDRIIVSIWKNEGYDDVVLNTWPISKKLNVNINYSIIDEGFISIYDLTDKLIRQEEISIRNSENNYTIDINNIDTNVYKVRISGTSFNVDKRMAFE